MTPPHFLSARNAAGDLVHVAAAGSYVNLRFVNEQSGSIDDDKESDSKPNRCPTTSAELTMPPCWHVNAGHLCRIIINTSSKSLSTGTSYISRVISSQSLIYASFIVKALTRGRADHDSKKFPLVTLNSDLRCWPSNLGVYYHADFYVKARMVIWVRLTDRTKVWRAGVQCCCSGNVEQPADGESLHQHHSNLQEQT